MGRIRDFFRPRADDAEQFNAFDSSEPIPSWAQWSGGALSSAGVRVNRGKAYGLPAYQRGVALLSETIGAMPFRALRSGQEQPDAPALALLNHPVPRELDMPATRFDVWSYTVAAMVDYGKAYLLKARASTGRVLALIPLDPARVRCSHEDGRHTYTLMGDNGQSTVLDPRNVLHINGKLGSMPCCGVSVIALHAEKLGTQLARAEFEGRFLAHDTESGVILTHPGQPNKQQRDELRTSWNHRRAGSGNAGSTGVLWGGWEAKQLQMNMRDAQFIESANLDVQDVARILGVPGGLLGVADAPGGDSVDQENSRFQTYGLNPWIERLAQGLVRDVDLFPGDGWDLRLDPSILMRLDLNTLVGAAHRARQAGLFTANELRPHIPFGPNDNHPDGDVLQVVPVGGGPERPATSQENQA